MRKTIVRTIFYLGLGLGVFSVTDRMVADAHASVEQLTVDCPIHGNSGAYFTGRTNSVDGVLLYEYRCPRGVGGHTFWVRGR